LYSLLIGPQISFFIAIDVVFVIVTGRNVLVSSSRATLTFAILSSSNSTSALAVNILRREPEAEKKECLWSIRIQEA